MRLNLGCGVKHQRGWLNADINPDVKPDVCFDMDKRWPFADDYFDYVQADHVLEHSQNYLSMLGELWRCCKDGALMDIKVPYVSWERNRVNPYHHVMFGEASFDFFDPDKLKGSANERNPIKFAVVSSKKVYRKVMQKWPKEKRKFAEVFYVNAVEGIHFVLRVIK